HGKAQPSGFFFAGWRRRIIWPLRVPAGISQGGDFKVKRPQNLRKQPDFPGTTRKTATYGTIVTVSQIA
ncbi:MAG: hypothetical protein ACK5ES_25975, partial [Planctomyces sp.]